ncbi:MAG: PQQ-dependent sugar dehydrogenase [Fimbriimonadaceae bacterium]|nr:PQQ-dependent sugar dehydrogenase [Fimbriimonadaceae bacterium]QYK58821.1 MAG: PQQ-dependent sugar dehydrogenase [Fimbriimonadaceae bacterium]
MRPLALLACATLAVPLLAQNLTPTVFVSGVSQPIAFVQDPLNPNVQFVVQQNGIIRTVINGVLQGTNFMQISVVTGGERGLLGMAFPPDHAQTGDFYLHFTTSDGAVFMQLARYTRNLLNPFVADPATRFNIFRTQRPFTNHNSGTIAFGPDGYLYLPTGDGGSAGDPGNRSQNPTNLLGKMVRLDVNGDDFPADPQKNYRIPPDNPFLSGVPITAEPEIWSFGIRNAWKFSFDSPALFGRGGMYIADVGQSTREEVNYEPAGAGGRNYGWRRWEGTFLFSSGTTLAYEPHTPPIYEYGRSVGGSITGGRLYRGLQLGPEFFERYFFADYVSGRVFSFRPTYNAVTGEVTQVSDVREHTADFDPIFGPGGVSSIDQDSEGELYTADIGGRIIRLNRLNHTWITDVVRRQGLITSGQVRSLVIDENRELVVIPFTAFFTPNRDTSIEAGFQTNRSSHSSLTLTINGRINQALNVPATFRLFNWTTNAWDVVGTANLVASPTENVVTRPSADYVSPSGRIEVRLDTNYNNFVLQPILATLWDRVRVVLQ